MIIRMPGPAVTVTRPRIRLGVGRIRGPSPPAGLPWQTAAADTAAGGHRGGRRPAPACFRPKLVTGAAGPRRLGGTGSERQALCDGPAPPLRLSRCTSIAPGPVLASGLLQVVTVYAGRGQRHGSHCD